jgi:hypothetical protein
MVTKMKPELIHGLPFDAYNAIEAERKSTLTAMAESPGAYRHRCDTPFEATPAMDFGDAVDTLLFEGKDALHERFAMKPEGMSLSTKDGRAFKKANEGKLIVPAHEVYSTALAVLMDPVAAGFLYEGDTQVSAFAQDEDSGLWCKVRPDICRRTYKPTDVPTLADLKVTGVFELHAWTRIAYRLKYHWQAAMYCDVMTAATGNYHEHFFFIVAENKPPHHVAVRECPVSVIEQGRADYKAALRKVRECRDANYWPTSTGEVQTMEFERWMR